MSPPAPAWPSAASSPTTPAIGAAGDRRVPASLAALLAAFMRQHAGAYAGSAAMLLGIALMIAWLPRQIGHMVDALVAQRLSGDALWREVAWLLGAGVLIYLLRVGWRLLLFGTAYRLAVQLRVQLFQRLALQGPRFYQGQRTGDLMALATNDVDAVEMAAGEALLAGFDGSLTLLLVVGTMALGVDWRLAAVVLLPFPLMALAFWHISRHLHDASAAALAAFAALNDQVQESLSGVRTLRALGLEARSSAQFGALAAQASATSLLAQRWEAAYAPAVGLTMGSATVLALGFGGWLVWQQQLSIGQLTSFGLYLGQLVWPMFAAGWVLALVERGRAAWARLVPVLNQPLAVDDHGTLASITPGALVVDGVGFSYPAPSAPVAADAGDTPTPAAAGAGLSTAAGSVANANAGRSASPALQGLSFSLPAGQTLGLVGPTGAGKSTLLKLLLRQWAPQQGQISWGGAALAEHTLAALRAGIAWVPQEPFLFSASVAENIALARPDATRAQIEAAARDAAVHDDIAALAQGYDTPVGERGITLSGGQRQRLAIARALLADAPLLLLDDALSAVDTETASRILATLRRHRQGQGQVNGQARSVIIASHRLATLVDADQILVLRHGQVSERGDHRSLLAQGSGPQHWYATQWQVQQLQAELDAD